MSETTYDNQAPIFRFLAKHRWRIILPMIFAAVFWAYPRYSREYVAVQQNLFVKSSVLDQKELRNKIDEIVNKNLSNNKLLDLAQKYNFFSEEGDQNKRLEKLRSSIQIRQDGEELSEGSAIFIWVNLRKEDSENIIGISEDLRISFENIEGLHMDKYISNPYDANPWRNYVFFGSLLQGLFMLVIPLILLWEIPNLFYSPKTKETVLVPLKSDWQSELTEAKLRNQTWKAFEINIRYSFAFLSAMIQKSPVGSLFEIFRKIVS